MKHNKKVNPLTHFNNLKAAAIKKAGGEMSKYKKSLKRADNGGEQVNSNIPDEYKDYERFSGPLREDQAKKLDRIFGPNTPMILSSDDINKYNNIRNTQEVFMRNAAPGRNYSGYENFNFKKGGSVKRKRK